MSFFRRMLSHEEKRRAQARKSPGRKDVDDEGQLMEIDTNCELKDDGETIPYPTRAPPPPMAQEAGFICPECMHVAASSEALLRHFQDHNNRARADVDPPPLPPQETSEAEDICNAILDSCLANIELEAAKLALEKKAKAQVEAEGELHDACGQVLEDLLVAVDADYAQHECTAVLQTIIDQVYTAADATPTKKQLIHQPQPMPLKRLEPEPVVVEALSDLLDELLLLDEVNQVISGLLFQVEQQQQQPHHQARVVTARDSNESVVTVAKDSISTDKVTANADPKTKPKTEAKTEAGEVEALVAETLTAVISSIEKIQPMAQPSPPAATIFQHKFGATLLFKLLQRKFQLRMLRTFTKLKLQPAMVTVTATAAAHLVTEGNRASATTTGKKNVHVDTDVYMEKSQVLDLLVHAGIDPAVLESTVGKKAMPSAAMRAQMAQALKAKHERKMDGSSQSGGSKVVKLKDDEAYGMFFKMMKAKVPRPAIEIKMRQKGLDPAMLDIDPESPSPNQPKEDDKAEVVALKDDEEYGPFFKMLKARVPRPAIEIKMKQKGLDPAMLDKDPESPSPNQPTQDKAEVVALKDDEEYGPFFKMLKARVPRPAIEIKMKQKGLDPAMLDNDPESPSPNQPKRKEDKAEVVALKDDEEYGPFFKMLKAKVPRPAIEIKMKQKGLDPTMLDKDPNSPSPNQPKQDKAEVVALKDDEEYGPFFKMLKARVPRPAIEIKMKQKGLDPAMLDKDPDSPSPNQPKQDDKAEAIALKDDEAYAPFFKMLKARVPRPAIEIKMKQKGLDPAMLDKDPNSPSPNQPKSESRVLLQDDEAYAAFFKMLKARVPRPAIEIKMKQKGLDPAMLDKDPATTYAPSSSSGSATTASAKKVKLKDDAAYGPFLKMLSAQVPRMAIELKMHQKGLDPSFLDQDPNSLITPSGSANTSSKNSATNNGGGLALGKGKVKLKSKKGKKVSLKPGMSEKKKAPSVMRRKLHWRKVSKFTLDKKETVWKRVGKFRFEEKELDELSRLFVQKIIPKERKASAVGSKTKGKAKKKSLLDMQRSQNVTIVLSRVKDWFSCPAIQRALCTMSNPKGASMEDVSTVLSFLPTDQEEKTLAAFKGDRKSLGLPEQYFLALMDISRFRIKTQILLFKLKFEELYDTIHDDCAFVLAACTDLVESDKFVRLLEVVLALGNVMNESDVSAFTLDSLNGLQAVKSFVGKTSALNYIALVMSTRQRQVLSFINSDIDKYRAASNIAFSNTMAQLRTLENGCKLVEREYKRLSDLIEGSKEGQGKGKSGDGDEGVVKVQAEVNRINQKTVPEEDRVFFHSLRSFHELVSTRMDNLLPKAKQTETKIAQMLDYFCMEQNTAPREVFGLVQSFMTQFQEAVRQNDAARSKAMKRARQRHLQKEKSTRMAKQDQEPNPTEKSTKSKLKPKPKPKPMVAKGKEHQPVAEEEERRKDPEKKEDHKENAADEDDDKIAMKEEKKVLKKQKEVRDIDVNQTNKAVPNG